MILKTEEIVRILQEEDKKGEETHGKIFSEGCEMSLRSERRGVISLAHREVVILERTAKKPMQPT